MPPLQQRGGGARRLGVPDAHDIFIGQGRRNERAVPRAVPRNPGADDGRKLADLHVDAAVGPRGEAQRAFVEPHAQAGLGRVEAAVGARLREKINLPAELRVEKNSEARVEERVAPGVDQAGRGRLKRVALEVERAADPRPRDGVERARGERLAEPVQQFVLRARARRERTAKEDDGAHPFHARGDVDGAERKRTSNSVPAESERARRKSPPCSRASSRARFRPRP